MTSSPSPLPGSGAWVTRWLSTARFEPYLRAANGDQALALRLYEWNADVSSAILHDLAHVEVGLRNAYNTALEQYSSYQPHWTLCSQEVFAPLYRTKRRSDSRTGHRVNVQVDINAKPRQNLDRAVREAGGRQANPGKIVAQLMFGFWRYLSSNAHEVALWRPYLHHAFPAGTARNQVDIPIGELHGLRNRVAHHEPVLAVDLQQANAQLLQVAGLVDPQLAVYIQSSSRVSALTNVRPSAK